MKTDAGMIESPFPTILVLLHSGELYMVASSPVLHSSYGFEYMPGVEVDPSSKRQSVM
jgi:hypothetical protein